VGITGINEITKIPETVKKYKKKVQTVTEGLNRPAPQGGGGEKVRGNMKECNDDESPKLTHASNKKKGGIFLFETSEGKKNPIERGEEKKQIRQKKRD